MVEQVAADGSSTGRDEGQERHRSVEPEHVAHDPEQAKQTFAPAGACPNTPPVPTVVAFKTPEKVPSGHFETHRPSEPRKSDVEEQAVHVVEVPAQLEQDESQVSHVPLLLKLLAGHEARHFPCDNAAPGTHAEQVAA